MPDVKNALKYQRKMIGIERGYVSAIQAKRRETRRILLEILDRDGISRQAVSRMVREIELLSSNLSGTGREFGVLVRTTAQNYMQQQLRLSKKAGLIESSDITPVVNAGQSAAQDGEQSYMTNTSAWVTELETSLQSQAAKLRLSQATPEEARARLFSETLADGRASVWLNDTNAAQTEETNNVWQYGVGLLAAYMMTHNEQTPQVVYRKQAIATIAERTTDCCLRVHGQVQDLDTPFRLTGTPRYADEIQDPPFHWYCRTSEALYHEEFEEFGIPTSEMVSAARNEIKARDETGSRVKIYPSHATARR